MHSSLILYPSPLLKRKCDSIVTFDYELVKLIMNLEEVRLAYDAEALAAPQINSSLAVFIMNTNDEIQVFVNPHIVNFSHEKVSLMESNLSIADVHAFIDRPKEITVKAQNLDGTFFTKKYSGKESHLIQQQVDLLNGILFIDKLPKQEQAT